VHGHRSGISDHKPLPSNFNSHSFDNFSAWHVLFISNDKKMKQREVQDKDNVTWQCVQAFAGLENNSTPISEKIKSADGTVPVVCTPSGGAQTIRLHLQEDWNDEMSDNDLLQELELHNRKKNLQTSKV
jgi:hypothetical protein